ncbi:SIR2 family protein [Enterobacter cloacae complex sp. P3B]|uniref:SIR2 family protein n=1 Tax=Enterobacter TaxID=547 RepID=UPI0018667D04|nr:MULTISPECIES: SIR2 family protein [Enterobacter]MBE3178450.1 SIR2 family protein [Enterobacter cloacae complex sp. P26RS]MBE3328889.1 SIR2 family protein [Enterobacter cloacae complex sp. P27C]MBE3433302.1 SIR2 family protein [Enterobacter cloacae complex sp. P21RS]MBE3459175.1 SIR2 family protein [Enterobacter cloacae complex sp. P21C]MBE3498707.1 SIR2 family protein [Enterobacter cloacae complex sp. P2B]
MKIKPQKHLINILTSTKNHHPNFTLFLGAGSSITSGVKSAGGMIQDWRDAYDDMHGEGEVRKQVWFDKDNEYSELFESLYDQPTQRREYIESCITAANPSWGYVYLVNLLKEKHFNTVFTTNFDDLLNEACYTFSDSLRPVVCAHDSSINSVRLTSSRPKIIKLHGDFLFDNIKNTIRELESLEDNMRSKFRQFANEFGMIVIGYSGHDRSIMDTLNTLLHSKNCFPHGIYWCTRDKFEDLPDGLKNLARFPRFHLIQITGFDEFMAELHLALGCKLQDEVVNPYSALSKKLDKYFTSLQDTDGDELSTHPLINSDMINLADHVRQVNSVSQFVRKIKTLLPSERTSIDDASITQSLEIMLKETRFAGGRDNILFYNTPNFLIANSAFRAEEYDECIEYCLKHLENGPFIEAVILICRAALKKRDLTLLDDNIKLLKSYAKIKDSEVSKAVNFCVELISDEDYPRALDILEYIESLPINVNHKDMILINKVLVAKLTEQQVSDKQKSSLRDIYNQSIDNNSYWVAFGAAVLLDDDEAAFGVADQLSESSFRSILWIEMPIFTLVSTPLYEKLIDLALTKGFEVPDVEETEEPVESESISNNQVADNQIKVEDLPTSTMMDENEISGSLTPTISSGIDEVKDTESTHTMHNSGTAI